MLKFASLAMAALTTVCVAQSPLTTLNIGGNSGNAGGGLYFDLTVLTKIQITQVNFRVQASATLNGTLDIYLGPSTYLGNVANPALWTLVATTGAIPLAPTSLNNGPLVTPICLEPGSYGIALKSNGFSHSYTNGTGCTSLTTPGACANTSFSTAELQLRGGAAQNAFLTGGVFSPRMVNCEIHYNVNPGCTTTSVASWQKVGVGCYDRARSFYENWPNPASADLGTVVTLPSGITSMMMTFAGANYLVTPGIAAIQAPTSPALGHTGSAGLQITLDPASPSVLVVIQGIPTPVTNVEMSSEGILTFNGTLSATAAPTPTLFLGGPAAIGYWKNINPAAAGASTHYQYDAALGAHLFTWLNCPDGTGAAPGPNNIQILMYNSGNIEMRFGVLSQLGGGSNPIVVGFSQGAPSLDPGNDDLSARLGGPTGSGFLTDPIDNPPVDLSLSARPILGTTPIFSTTNMEVGFGGFLLVGFVGTAGTSLLSFGIPECLSYIDLSSSPVSTLFIGNPGSIGFSIPNNAGLAGVQLVGQSAVLGSTFNSAFGIGIATSNRVNIKCGTL